MALIDISKIEVTIHASIHLTDPKELEAMTEALQRLTERVKAMQTVETSAVVLIQQLAQQVRDAIANDDTSALVDLANNLDAQAKDLANAVAANTPAAPAGDPPVTPTPTPTPTPSDPAPTDPAPTDPAPTDPLPPVQTGDTPSGGDTPGVGSDTPTGDTPSDGTVSDGTLDGSRPVSEL